MVKNDRPCELVPLYVLLGFCSKLTALALFSLRTGNFRLTQAFRPRNVAFRSACQRRLKIPHFAGRKFLTPEVHEWASLASDAVEPSAAFWRVLGETEAEAKEWEAAARSCSRGGTNPALRRSFNR
jgi:hypothetical protein